MSALVRYLALGIRDAQTLRSVQHSRRPPFRIRFQHLTGSAARLALVCVVAVQLARADALTVQIESAPVAQVQATITSAKIAHGSHYDVRIVNRSSSGARLQRISAHLRLDRPIPEGTRYMIGADAQEPDGHLEQLVVGKPASNDFSNMYVLFRRAAADYLLVGVSSTIDAPNVFLAQSEDGRVVLALFNWDDDARVFSLVGFAGEPRFRPMAGSAPIRFEAGQLVLLLPGVESILLEYTGVESFHELRRRLDVSSRPGHPERP